MESHKISLGNKLLVSSETPLKINYTILGIVSDVHEEFGSKYIGGAGNDCAFERYSIGWYVTFSGSHEALFFGHTKPDLNPGDNVKITFERIAHALPSKSSIE